MEQGETYFGSTKMGVDLDSKGLYETGVDLEGKKENGFGS